MHFPQMIDFLIHRGQENSADSADFSVEVIKSGKVAKSCRVARLQGGKVAKWRVASTPCNYAALQLCHLIIKTAAMNRTFRLLLGIVILGVVGIVAWQMLPSLIGRLPNAVQQQLPHEVRALVSTPLPTALPAPEFVVQTTAVISHPHPHPHRNSNGHTHPVSRPTNRSQRHSRAISHTTCPPARPCLPPLLLTVSKSTRKVSTTAARPI